MEQAYKTHIMQPRLYGMGDPAASNRMRVFAEAMRETPSEIMAGRVFGEVLSSRLRDKRFMEASQKASHMGIEDMLARLGEHKRDYPGVIFHFVAEKRPVFYEGGLEAYWIEIKDDGRLLGDNGKAYRPMVLAEARGIAIAEKGTFKLRFSDALIRIAGALDSVAPSSIINPNYHLSWEGGKPNEIAEILLEENDEGKTGTLKVCIGEITQKEKGMRGRKKDIFGTLYLMLEGNAGQGEMASVPKAQEEYLAARFSQMESFLRSIVPPEISGGLGIYRCLKQVHL